MNGKLGYIFFSWLHRKKSAATISLLFGILYFRKRVFIELKGKDKPIKLETFDSKIHSIYQIHRLRDHWKHWDNKFYICECKKACIPTCTYIHKVRERWTEIKRHNIKILQNITIVKSSKVVYKVIEIIHNLTSIKTSVKSKKFG